MNIQRQNGMSTTNMLVVALVVGFFIFCGFKIIPAYFDNLTVQSGMRELAEKYSDEMHSMTKSKAQTHMGNFYALNNVRGVAAAAPQVQKERERVLVNINYEVRVNLFSNVDVVMVFNNQLDSSAPDECCTVKEKSGSGEKK